MFQTKYIQSLNQTWTLLFCRKYFCIKEEHSTIKLKENLESCLSFDIQKYENEKAVFSQLIKYYTQNKIKIQATEIVLGVIHE